MTFLTYFQFGKKRKSGRLFELFQKLSLAADECPKVEQVRSLITFRCIFEVIAPGQLVKV